MRARRRLPPSCHRLRRHWVPRARRLSLRGKREGSEKKEDEDEGKAKEVRTVPSPSKALGAKGPPPLPKGLGAKAALSVAGKASDGAQDTSGGEGKREASVEIEGVDETKAKVVRTLPPPSKALSSKGLPLLPKGLGAKAAGSVTAKAPGDGEDASLSEGKMESSAEENEEEGKATVAGKLPPPSKALGAKGPPLFAKGLGAKPALSVTGKAPGDVKDASGSEGKSEGSVERESEVDSKAKVAGKLPPPSKAVGAKGPPPLPKGLGATAAASAASTPAGDGEDSAAAEGKREGSEKKEDDEESKAKVAGKLPPPSKALGAKGPPPLPEGLGAKAAVSEAAKAPGEGEDSAEAAGKREGSEKKDDEEESKAKVAGKLPPPSKALGAKGPPPLPKGLGAKAAVSEPAKASGDGGDSPKSDGKKEDPEKKEDEDESKAKAAVSEAAKAPGDNKDSAEAEGKREGSEKKDDEEESKAKVAGKLPPPSKALGAKGPPPLPEGLGAKAAVSEAAKAPGEGKDSAEAEGKSEGSEKKADEDESKAKVPAKLPPPSKALGAKGPPPLPKGLGAKGALPVAGKAPRDVKDASGTEGKREGSVEKEKEDEDKAKVAGKLPPSSKALGSKGPPLLPKGLGAKGVGAVAKASRVAEDVAVAEVKGGSAKKEDEDKSKAKAVSKVRLPSREMSAEGSEKKNAPDGAASEDSGAPPSIPNEPLKEAGLRVLRQLSDSSASSERGPSLEGSKSAPPLGGTLESVGVMKLSMALLARGAGAKTADKPPNKEAASPETPTPDGMPLKASSPSREEVQVKAKLSAKAVKAAQTPLTKSVSSSKMMPLKVVSKKVPSSTDEGRETVKAGPDAKTIETSVSKSGALPKRATPEFVPLKALKSTAKAREKPETAPAAVDIEGKKKAPRDWCFAPTAVDTALLAFETQDHVSTGNTFYNLGPKAVVESLAKFDPFQQSSHLPVSEMDTVSQALVCFDEIKGLYDSPTDLIPWDCSLKASASGSCVQIRKLPPVQYATALSVWSELLLHQKSQVISVVGGCHQGSDRTVLSLLAAFGLLSGFAVKEQMHFIGTVRRIYETLARWSTVASPDKGECSLCQWRWVIGFTSSGEPRGISLRGFVLHKPPPVDEGLPKIVLSTVQCALSDDSTPQTLGLPGLSFETVQDSLQHGNVNRFEESEEASKRLSAVKEELRTALSCDIMEATSILRICLVYWVLSRGTNLRSEDIDLTEQLLGTQKGLVHTLFKQCSEQEEDVSAQLRSALYESLFDFVVQLANRQLQRSFQPLLPVKSFSPQSRALEIIIEEAPFSNSADGQLSFGGLAIQALQVLHLGVAFRGIHNLQRILDADEVKLPLYLNSMGQKPHVQLLLQLLFSRRGGLLPFLAGGQRNQEDMAAWMEWASTKPGTQEVLNAAPDGSLLIDWLGQWSRTTFEELEAASSAMKGPTFRLIGSLLRSASATRMCGRITNWSPAARLLHAVQGSLAVDLVERPVLVVRSSDPRLTSWTYEELRKVEDWQSFGFPVVARLEDLPKYCPQLFGEAACEDKDKITGLLGQYISLNEFVVGNALVFLRSAAYNSLYGFELAAKSIAEERAAKLQLIERQREELQALKAKLGGSTEKVGARLQEAAKSPASVILGSGHSSRSPSGDPLGDQRLLSKSSDGLKHSSSISGSSSSVAESSRKFSDSSRGSSSAEGARCLDASARLWHSCPVALEPEGEREDKALRPSLSAGVFGSTSRLLSFKAGENPADVLRMRQYRGLNDKLPSFLKARVAGSMSSIGTKEGSAEMGARVNRKDSAVAVKQAPSSAAAKGKLPPKLPPKQLLKGSTPDGQTPSESEYSRTSSMKRDAQKLGNGEEASGSIDLQETSQKSGELAVGDGSGSEGGEEDKDGRNNSKASSDVSARAVNSENAVGMLLGKAGNAAVKISTLLKSRSQVDESKTEGDEESQADKDEENKKSETEHDDTEKNLKASNDDTNSELPSASKASIDSHENPEVGINHSRSKQDFDKEAEEQIPPPAILPEEKPLSKQASSASLSQGTDATAPNEKSIQGKKALPAGGIKAMWRTNQKDKAWKGLVVVSKESKEESNPR
ncbi:hypothetical protein, conserved [Eimeria brunetti]|uniref:Uncharacterized protein n=1 Tax=Eimeria brunetti TaxID=51314 RepID=U6LP46_9EIME|nr:hypothetical protein, conserved [Eimeria brunetti]